MAPPLQSSVVSGSLERTFRITAVAEAASFLALLVAYVVLALNLARQARRRAGTTLRVLIGAVLPFGGFVVDRWLARRPVGLRG